MFRQDIKRTDKIPPTLDSESGIMKSIRPAGPERTDFQNVLQSDPIPVLADAPVDGDILSALQPPSKYGLPLQVPVAAIVRPTGGDNKAQPELYPDCISGTGNQSLSAKHCTAWPQLLPW